MEVTLGPFKATISNMGEQKVILIPKELHEKVDKFKNVKKVNIKIHIDDLD